MVSLVVSVGLYEFFYKFIPEPEGAPIATKFNNFIQSIPNDDDLDSIYELERRDYKERTDRENMERLNRAKADIALRIVWKSQVQLKSCDGSWNHVILALQGRKLIWWSNEGEARQGPTRSKGVLMLCGHAGVSKPSVIDLREAQTFLPNQDKTQDPALLCVFGSDLAFQPAKVVICFAISDQKQELERHIQLMT